MKNILVIEESSTPENYTRENWIPNPHSAHSMIRTGVTTPTWPTTRLSRYSASVYSAMFENLGIHNQCFHQNAPKAILEK